MAGLLVFIFVVCLFYIEVQVHAGKKDEIFKTAAVMGVTVSNEFP